MPKHVVYTLAGMLFIGAAPLPYGYYMFLRLIACGVFAYASFLAYSKNCRALPWVYGLLALLFNPFVKIHLPKEMWVFVDIGAGILVLATARKVTTNV